MKRLTLGDVCKKASSNIAQKDLQDKMGAYPIYGASGLIKQVDFYQQDKEYIAVVKDGAGIGRTMLLPAYSSVIGTMQYLLPKEGVPIDIKYLFYAVEHMNLAKYFSGATIPHIYFKDYQKEPINIPDIDTQRKISRIFDKIDALITSRKEQRTKLDQIVKSRFIEMFGDPVTNSKGLVTRKGLEFFTLTNGKFVPEEKRRDKGIPAYGGNGISWYTDEILVTHDTIVVGRVGFQSGNVHFVTGPLWVTDNAMYISDFNKEQYDLRFLCALMEHIDFTRFQDAGDLKKITQKPFMQMRFIAPSMQQQKSFIAFVTQTDKSKYRQEKCIRFFQCLEKNIRQEWL